jgi:hypothetical protein
VCKYHTHACLNHTLHVEITLVSVIITLMVWKSSLCVSKSRFAWKNHTVCKNHTRAWKNHTRPCKNYTCKLVISHFVCKCHTRACLNHTLHIVITLVSVKISLMVWIHTSVYCNHTCVCRNHTLRKKKLHCV